MKHFTKERKEQCLKKWRKFLREIDEDAASDESTHTPNYWHREYWRSCGLCAAASEIASSACGLECDCCDLNSVVIDGIVNIECCSVYRAITYAAGKQYNAARCVGEEILEAIAAIPAED
ncbi:MAG: hypothetical protein DRI48_06030 [Chloroflexi bacterium]|nr:MAG: hypothetical protein DRI48_06030 [Chloroflexota bacterium]